MSINQGSGPADKRQLRGVSRLGIAWLAWGMFMVGACHTGQPRSSVERSSRREGQTATGSASNDAVGNALAHAEQRVGMKGTGSAAAERATGDTVPIEDPSGRALDDFFKALDALQLGNMRRVRVMHWGDSHVAADVMTGQLRRLFQQRFGDGGAGLVLLGKPWRSYRHEGILEGANGRWRAERLWTRYHPRRRPRPRDDLLGVAGISVSATGKARAWVERTDGPIDRVGLYFLRQSGGGTLELWADGSQIKRVDMRSSTKRGGYVAIDLPGSGVRRLELHTSGGEVRLYGVDLLRTRSAGVVYDGLGINGARADSQQQWNEPLVAEQLHTLAPKLLVIAYGSNELDSRTLTGSSFAGAFVGTLQRVRRLAQQLGASCLVVGPGDQARRGRGRDRSWSIPPVLDDVVEVQRTLAAAHGCAFWDQRAAMGGKGSIFSWVGADPPLARRDHLHLRQAGYQQLGEALYRALISSYAWYRSRRGPRGRATPGLAIPRP